MKVTVSFKDNELYRAIRVRAVQDGRPMRDIVEEALQTWLEAREDAEDAVASADALVEYEQAGGVDADRYFERLVAEGRITYEGS